MGSLDKRRDLYIIVIPSIGMSLFLIFYGIAAFLYPGGSFSDPTSTNFSFNNNYLCDLLDSQAINGEINTASTTSRIAFGFLCVTMIFIWYQLPKLFGNITFKRQLIRITGILSMLIALFLASHIHDVIVYAAGITGFIAYIITFIELYKHRFFGLLSFGIISLVLILLNYSIYAYGYWITALPIIQKVTFVYAISWFLMLMVATYKRL